MRLIPCRSKMLNSSRSVAPTPARRLRVRSSLTSDSGKLSSARRRLSAAESRSLAKPATANLDASSLALGAAAYILGLGERAQQAILLLGELGLELDNSCLRRRFSCIRFDRSVLRAADVVVGGLVELGTLLLLVFDILHRLSHPIKRPIILAV